MLIPAVTMRSFSEEKRAGTLDLLLMRPLSELQITFAKYLASVSLIILALLPTLVYYFSVISLGNPVGNIDKGGTWGSYIGLIMLACSYAAIGVFCSTLTDNLVVSFLLAALMCLFICYGLEQLGSLISPGEAGKVLLSLGIIEHYKSMSRGVIDTRDVVYFLALVMIFIYLSKTRLESHKK
jgi:ABC-2 type transport system permease protein